MGNRLRILHSGDAKTRALSTERNQMLPLDKAGIRVPHATEFLSRRRRANTHRPRIRTAAFHVANCFIPVSVASLGELSVSNFT